MNKVFVLPPREDWIVDRFVKEWNEDNTDISTLDPYSSDVIWLLADWCWNQIPSRLLASKKIITSVHHIVPTKFGNSELADFKKRDEFTTVYHVYNQLTYDFIKPLTNKPIHLISYWANQKIWKKTGDKFDLRKKYKIPESSYVVGSFQRDTEGHDLRSPKLEKGPDLLADFLEKKKQQQDVFVVLCGWRRQYIINRLNDSKIPYVFFERPGHSVINDLYQCLDLYPVTARFEGGPQSLIECGLLNIPTISRNIGIADQVLPQTAINDDVFLAQPAIPNVESWKLPSGYQKYRNLIQSL